MFTTFGISATQGPHQVAQKSTRTTLPRSFARSTSEPSTAVNLRSTGFVLRSAMTLALSMRPLIILLRGLSGKSLRCSSARFCHSSGLSTPESTSSMVESTLMPLASALVPASASVDFRMSLNALLRSPLLCKPSPVRACSVMPSKRRSFQRRESVGYLSRNDFATSSSSLRPLVSKAFISSRVFGRSLGSRRAFMLSSTFCQRVSAPEVLSAETFLASPS